MIGDRSVQPTATRRRRVVAHAPQGLVCLEGHRLDVETGTLGVEAGQVAQGRRERLGLLLQRRGGGLRAVFMDGSRRVMDRQRAQDVRLGVGVLEDRPAVGLDEEQLARSEPPTTDRLGRGERDGAGLGRDGHQPVARDGEGDRSQPVAVDERADASPIGEHDGGRTVPRREEPGRPTAERGDVRMRRAAQTQRLGDRREQRRRQVPAGGGEQLERLVERERVGAVRGEQRAGGQERLGDGLGAGVLGPATDLLAVATDRVDLAVVGDRAERLGEAPDRVRVGRVALVEDRIADADAGRAGPGRAAAAGRPSRGPCRRWSGTTPTTRTARPSRRALADGALERAAGDDQHPLEDRVA